MASAARRGVARGRVVVHDGDGVRAVIARGTPRGQRGVRRGPRRGAPGAERGAMTFAAPLFAWIAGGVAAATIALHLLAWRRPPETLLPTARFAPERPIRMVSRALRPADLALMVLLVVLVGVALARPSFHARREGLGRVVVIDRSAAAPGTAIATSARGVFRPGDAVIVFD